MFLPEDEELMVAVDEVFAWGKHCVLLIDRTETLKR